MSSRSPAPFAAEQNWVDSVEAVRLQVKGRNVDVSESLKAYAQQKLSKLDKHVGSSARLELELAVERNPSISQNQIAEATIWTKGPVLRARETSSDMRASIDQLVDKLERQARRYRDRRRRGSSREQPPVETAADERELAIVKTKQFTIAPMTSEEAALQLELVGHDFFVFQNAETGVVNVLYRRRDRGYGLIEPQLPE
jgi:putative sigma-54 modulation protein